MSGRNPKPVDQSRDLNHATARLDVMSFSKSFESGCDDFSTSALKLPRRSASHTADPPQQRNKAISHRTNDHLGSINPRLGDSSYSSPDGYAGRNQSRGQKKLRRYQEELALPAKSGDNYIICAPTGSGKTLTAASICRHSYDIAKEKGNTFRALFIVNIRCLTQQQTAAFREIFPVGTVATIGETDMLRTVVFHKSHVVTMVTAQILVNALNKTPADLKLSDISMIIFDECHHTTQDHPYNEIMKRYLMEKKTRLGPRRRIGKSGPYLPQIIGLSASLGVGHGNDAYHHVLTLCSNMDANNVIQVRRYIDELDTHVNAPEKDVIHYVHRLHVANRDLGIIIADIMSQIEGQLWDQVDVPAHASQAYEEWAVTTRQKAEIDSDRSRLVACLYLFEYNRSLMLYEDLRAVDSFGYLEAALRKRYVQQEFVPIEDLSRGLFDASNADMKMICREETDADCPKLEELAKLLRRKFEDKPHSKGIVLTRMRFATDALVKFIKETRILRGLRQPVTPIRLVGQGETDNYFMSEREQQTALKHFREDDSCNLLVATDIAQEGLDMPACNFVIRYNFVSNEIGTVQSKGRARAKQSECFLIVEEGSKNANRELKNRQKVIDMQKAMEKLNGLPERKRLQDITERQDEIYKAMEEKEQTNKRNRGIHNRNEVEILCKECNVRITLGSYIRRKGCHFTCVDPDIRSRIEIIPSPKMVFRDTENVGIFKCGNPTCGQQLGIAINFLDGQPPVVTHKGYGFKVQSFLFKLPGGTKRTFKQWKKVTFDIPDMTD